MSDTETDEWTPSTEQVRSHYVFNQSNQWDAERGEAFDRWLATHDAEVQAQVVAEEPGWEYGVRLTGGDRDRRTAGYIYRWPSLAQAEDQAALNFDASAEFFTRIKAGPWVPVKQEGAEQ